MNMFKRFAPGKNCDHPKMVQTGEFQHKNGLQGKPYWVRRWECCTCYHVQYVKIGETE